MPLLPFAQVSCLTALRTSSCPDLLGNLLHHHLLQVPIPDWHRQGAGSCWELLQWVCLAREPPSVAGSHSPFLIATLSLSGWYPKVLGLHEDT